MHAACKLQYRRLHRWLVTWTQHNSGSDDPVGALMMAAQRMGGRITEAQAIAIIDYAKKSPKARTADSVARQLGLTYRVREELRITTIGSIDVGPKGRKEIRKLKARRRDERRRRARVSRPDSKKMPRPPKRTGLELNRARPLKSPVSLSAPTRNVAFGSAPCLICAFG